MKTMHVTRFPAVLLAALLLSLAGSACGGCGDDPPGGGADTDVDEVDAGNNGEADTDITAPGPDAGPLQPVPANLVLRMTPGRDTYPLGLRLLPEVETFDSNGEPADYDVEISVEPPGAANQFDERYELTAEGVVRFTACTTHNGVDGEPVCGWDEVVVNDGPPVITLTSPAAGAQLDATNDPVIEVAGTVTDTFGTPVAFLNGAPLELDEQGAFMATIEPRFGVNHIEVAASDGSHAGTSEAVVDVHWAPDYAAPADPPVDFEEALVLRLGQQFVDDRQRVGTQPDGTYLTKDLADVLELVIRNIDLASQIPDPVLDSSAMFLRVTQVAIGKPLIQLDLTDTGLEVFIQVSDLQAVTTGFMQLDDQQLSLDGTITGSMSALVVLDVEKASATAPISATVSSLSVAVENVTPNFVSAEVNAIFTLAQSVLRTTIENLLMDVLQGSFVDQLPTLLTDVLSSLDSVFAGQSLALDTGLGDPIQITLDGGVRTVSSAWRHHLDASLGLTGATDVSGVHADSRGYPLLWPGAMQPAFFEDGRIQFGLRFAMINALLHALWDAGLLEADVTDVVPVNVDGARLSAKLPPIVRPPLLGEPHDFVIELGQVEIETEVLGREDRYGVSISTGVDFAIDSGALVVTIGEMPRIETWLISSSEDVPFLTPDALRDLIEAQVWPQFTAALAGGLSLPLPAPDLSGLGSVAAPLANLTLAFEQVLPLAIREGWIIIDATMEGTL